MAGRAFPLAVVVGGAALLSQGVAAARCKVGLIAELPVTLNGMRPMITAKINGQDARFIVDSGAFFSLITPGKPLTTSSKPSPRPSTCGCKASAAHLAPG